MSKRRIKKLPAAFYRTSTGTEPVREWLLDQSADDRRMIGYDIATAELGWPIGMPLCRSIVGRKGLWEVRTNLTDGKIARVFFCVSGSRMVLLHGIVKKTQKTPAKDLDIAEKRMKEMK